MAAGDFYDTLAAGNTGGQQTYNGNWIGGGPGTYNPQHAHTFEPITDYKAIFEKSIVLILGSSRVSQDTKDEFINNCIPLEEFRKFVSEYFPQYADKIRLWEKLHGL
jgi:hypothetical protein